MLVHLVRPHAFLPHEVKGDVEQILRPRACLQVTLEYPSQTDAIEVAIVVNPDARLANEVGMMLRDFKVVGREQIRQNFFANGNDLASDAPVRN